MKVTFWGVRGSIPSPIHGARIREKILRALREFPGDVDPEDWLASKSLGYASTYGGETPCVEVTSGNRRIILDAGSGIRRLGMKMAMKNDYGRGTHICLSHFHWDHIQGIPFFVPLYKPDADMNFYSGRKDMETLLGGQHRSPYFPLDFNLIPSKMKFHRIDESINIDGLKVSIVSLEHPDISYGYRIDDGNSSVVYLTDVELLEADRTKMDVYREFVRDASLIIADVQYGFVETREKRTWGHSSIFAFADLLARSGVKHLAMFHHDPTSSDEALDELQERARKYVGSQPGLADMKITTSYVGLELDV